MSNKFVEVSEVERLKRAQENLRANASPEVLEMIHQSDIVFGAIANEFDDRLNHEHALRAWAKALCGFNVDISEMEELSSSCKELAKGTVLTFKAKRGTVQIVRTAFDTIDRVDRYLNTLERTVIDITNNSQFTALPFLDLMKLAFRRLFKRSK